MSALKDFVNEDASGFDGTTDKGLFIATKDVTLSTLLLSSVNSNAWEVYIDAPKPGVPGTYNSYLWISVTDSKIVENEKMRLKAGYRIRVITGITPGACTLTFLYEENPL